MSADFLCLGALSMGPASGYDIHRMLQSTDLKLVATAGQASIYGALARLQAAQLVTSHKERGADGRPDRVVYEVTDAGKKALANGLADNQSRSGSEHPIALMAYFGDMVRPDVLSDRVGRRLAHLRGLADHSRKGRSVDESSIALWAVRYRLAAIDLEIERLEELLERS